MERSRILLEDALLAGDKDDNTCDNLNKPVIKPNTGDKAQQQRQKILTFLETVDFITNKQVCILLEVNRSRAYDLLSQMVCESLLVAEGDKKGRRYRLSRIDSC